MYVGTFDEGNQDAVIGLKPFARDGAISFAAASCTVLQGYTSLGDVDINTGSVYGIESVVILTQSPEFGLKSINWKPLH